ncbi:MAG: Flp pilus assembly protein CpaB [Pirellulales bacterium]|nr:Flp pilus assembly protein CpaB [Pirellulales bacterium]
MQLKSAILLLLALGCGLVAAIGVTQVISKDAEPAAETGNERSVFVAMQDIAPGELITPQMVRLETWPKDKVPEGVFDKIEDLEGCRARVEILQGDPVREKKLLGKGVTQQTPTDYIPKGYRVVGVKVDMVSGAGLIRPGDRVDVLVHLRRNVQNDIKENRTQTILQDIKVFAVDDIFKLQPGGTEEDSTIAKTISLLVTPDQAEKVILASQLGNVQLVMRSPGDSDTSPTAGVTPSELLGSTDKSNREAEQKPGLPGQTPSGGLFDLLKNMQAKQEEKKPATQPVAQVVEPSRWNVRLLQGPEINDVTLQSQTDPASGVTVWRSDSYGQSATASPTYPASSFTIEPQPPAPPTPQPTPPAAPPAPSSQPVTS